MFCGTFSLTSITAIVAHALLGAAIPFLLIKAADGLTAVEVAMQGPSLEELEERAPFRPNARTPGKVGLTAPTEPRRSSDGLVGSSACMWGSGNVRRNKKAPYPCFRR